MADDVVHTFPVDDLVEHDTDELPGEPFNDECICGPDVEPVGDGWQITHHSLDGRELTEHPQGGDPVV